jgi:hypothetical protein
VASVFTSHPKEGVLLIFVAFQNPSPRPGLNPRPLGSVASTITTTSPRLLIICVNVKNCLGLRIHKKLASPHQISGPDSRCTLGPPVDHNNVFPCTDNPLRIPPPAYSSSAISYKWYFKDVTRHTQKQNNVNKCLNLKHPKEFGIILLTFLMFNEVLFLCILDNRAHLFKELEVLKSFTNIKNSNILKN